MSESFQIVEYNTTAAALTELRARHGGPFDVSTSKGMTAAKEARAEVKGYRVALERLRVELKAPALERTRLIDAEAKRITAELLAIEEPIDAAIKAEEKRKEEEKAAKARQEAARVAAIAARISGIRNRVGTVANQPAATIRATLEQVHNLDLVPRDFEEFLPDALQALDETRAALATLLLERVAYEEEQARLQAEREAEQERLRAEREELERLRAERAEMERQRADLAERQRAMEEAQQAREAERQRKEQEEMEKAAKAKAAKRGKADPLAEIKKAVSEGIMTADEAMEKAYQIGFQAGINARPAA